MKDVQSNILDKCALKIQEMKLPESYMLVVESILLKLSEVVASLKMGSTRPLFVSINGAQGTGKSTLTQFLKLLLENRYSIGVTVISLDDFYLTRQERINLSEAVHPLFMTRGVPGTHDLALLDKTMNTLMNYEPCLIPQFNKAIDDRLGVGDWMQSEPSDVILFEGWCNQSPVQNEDELESPINELEEKEDSTGVWRRYVNDALNNYHDKVFSRADLTMMLAPPDFDSIFEWRKLQEDKLLQASSNFSGRVMNEIQLVRFIQHYERITRHTLKYLPDLADIVLPINSQHLIEEIRFRNDW